MCVKYGPKDQRMSKIAKEKKRKRKRKRKRKEK
jgi:hypothetical protein